MFNRNRGFHSQQHRSRISRQIRRAGAVDFFNLLTGPELLEMTEMHLPEHRERLYPPTVALSMFMKQSLAVDRSCQRAVDAWAAQRAAEGLNVQSIRTGAYCRSRARLPLEMIIALTRESGRLLSARAQRGWRWRGRCVKLADGTGISMPDTPENQARYPQPLSQAEGVGFPLAGLVGIVCLSTGAVLEAAIGAHASKGQSEQDLFRGLLSTLRPGDVLLADALYCSYFLIATLQAAGVDVLFEQHGSRHTDFRRGRALGRRDHVVCWPKPTTRPAWMSREQYRAFPEQLSVREAKVDGQVLVTTMLNAPQVRKSELASLYARRWHVELDIRNIKTTLGMEVLRCLTPQMVQKELWVSLLAYNLIRLLMAQAAHNAGVHPRELSFKHTVQMWAAWSTHAPHVLAQPNDFFRLIAQLSVGSRPGRIEPRARKRRPKSFPWLKVPRAAARRQIRRYGHLLCA
ncbi:MAG: IS4 family transposase [Steroidobacteraceae bacterium]